MQNLPIPSQGSPSSLGGVNETYKVVDFRRHEKFNIATVYFDVCLLKLNLPVALTEKSYPICLGKGFIFVIIMHQLNFLRVTF